MIRNADGVIFFDAVLRAGSAIGLEPLGVLE
jgi:hypothetical protein